jgi:hypothetical protein
MARTIDLICRSCKHAYHVACDSLIKDDEKNCPECGSSSYRQTFAGYRRNGSLVDLRWAQLAGDRHSHYG